MSSQLKLNKRPFHFCVGNLIGDPLLDQGVNELLRAYELSVDAQRDKWDFAIEMKTLLEMGLTTSAFRWLVCKGIVEHACEVTDVDDSERRFRPTNALNFKKRTCFVLTDEFVGRNHVRQNAVLPLRAGLADEAREMTPQWHTGRHELVVANFLVKRFRWPAKNQETVLAALQEEAWTTGGVDDPLPPHPDRDSKQRLRDTIKCLNRYQQHRFLRFRCDGSGERVIWEFTARALEMLDIDRFGSAPTRRKSS